MIVAELLAKLGLNVDKDSFKEGNAALTALKAGAAALISAAALSGLVSFMNSISSVADHAVKASQKLGITAEAVQELGYAAEASDLSQEQLEAGLGKLALNLREVARTGAGPAAKALWSLRVPFKDLKNKTPDQNLERLALAFQKLPDGAKKAHLASSLFGKSLGTAFIPLLNSGKDGIIELRNRARELGNVVSTQVAKDFEAFNDTQTELAATWRGIKTQIAVGLLPIFSRVATRIKEWLEANRELIANKLQSFLSGVLSAISFLSAAVANLTVVLGILGSFVSVAGALLGALTAAINWLRQGSDLANSVLIALGITLAIYFGPAALKAIVFYFVSLTAAVVGTTAPMLTLAAAATLATIKFVLIAAAIAALVYGLTYLIKHPDKVKKAFKVAWEFIKDKADWLWQKLKGIGQSIANFFTETIPNGIKRAFNAAFEWLVNLPVIKQLIQLVSDIASIADIPEQFDTSNEKLVQDSAEAELNGTKDQFRAAHPEVFNQVLSPEEQAWLGNSGQGGVSTTNTFGDVNVTVNAAPGQSEKAIGESVAKNATEAQRRMLSDAHSRLRGGYR